MSLSLRDSINTFCTNIARDRLLVQGAGGNVSWKEGNCLWVKASGKWLSDANSSDIFVPVDLNAILESIANYDFSIEPVVLSSCGLKPSIETIFHALMPQKIVVHLHAVEILAHLVREDCAKYFSSIIDPSISWCIVEYFKPGSILAEAVYSELSKESSIDVVFLKNHGVILGGDSIAEVNHLLTILLKNFTVEFEQSRIVLNDGGQSKNIDGFKFLNDEDIQQLILNESLFSRLSTDWVLYPDHVVFLGPKAHFYQTIELFGLNYKSTDNADILFIKDYGVFTKDQFSDAKLAQLRCYYDVLIRQDEDTNLKTLSQSEIFELLNWDAEKYRMSLEK